MKGLIKLETQEQMKLNMFKVSNEVVNVKDDSKETLRLCESIIEKAKSNLNKLGEQLAKGVEVNNKST